MTDSLKSTIIARAEAESSDEDAEEETEAFLEDFDDPTRGTFVRDGGEGEEADEKEAQSGAATPVVVGSSLFDRGGRDLTRRRIRWRTLSLLEWPVCSNRLISPIRRCSRGIRS